MGIFVKGSLALKQQPMEIDMNTRKASSAVYYLLATAYVASLMVVFNTMASQIL